MERINYKAKFLYQEFTGQNIIKIIELLKYDSNATEEFNIRNIEGLYEIAIVTSTTLLTKNTINLKANDILAYDNGIYKKVTKEEIKERELHKISEDDDNG